MGAGVSDGTQELPGCLQIRHDRCGIDVPEIGHNVRNRCSQNRTLSGKDFPKMGHIREFPREVD